MLAHHRSTASSAYLHTEIFIESGEGQPAGRPLDDVSPGEQQGFLVRFKLYARCRFWLYFGLCVQKLGQDAGDTAGGVLADEFGKCVFGINLSQISTGELAISHHPTSNASPRAVFNRRLALW